MKLIALNDLHFDSRTPSSRTDDYEAELLDLLGQVCQLAQGVQASAVLIAGDVFHRDTIALASLIKLYRWCESLPTTCRLFAIPGNHDLRHDRLDTLPQTALGLLFATGVVEHVTMERGACVTNAARETVLVSGVPFPDALSFERWVNVANPSVRHLQPRIVMGHCFADREPGDFWGTPVHGYAQLATLPFDVFIFGHDHRDQGVAKIGDKWFVNLGALARGALTDEDVTRQIKVALIETHPLAVTQVKLRYRPAAEIFDLAVRDSLRREHAEITAFVENLKADLARTATAVGLVERIQALSLPDAVRARVLRYLEDADRAG